MLKILMRTKIGRHAKKALVALALLAGCVALSRAIPAMIVRVIVLAAESSGGAEACKVMAPHMAAPELAAVRPWLEEAVPSQATDLKVEYSPGSFAGGSLKRVRCRVGKEAMRSFAQKSGSRWRFDSTMSNDMRTYEGVLEPPKWSGKFWRGDCFPDGRGEFWSYNRVYRNGGGCRCYYDVGSETLYYEMSSN